MSLGINTTAIVLLSLYFYHYGDSYFTIIDTGDDRLFYQASKDLGENFKNGIWEYHSVYSGYSGYGFILIGGIVDYLFSFIGGINEVTLKIINAIAGSLIPVIVYKTCLLFKNHDYLKNENLPVILTIFFPILIYYSSVGNRDIWISLITISIFYLLIKGKIVDLVFIATFILIVFLFRPFSAYVLFFIVIIYFCVIYGSIKITTVKGLTLVILTITSFIYLYGIGSEYFELFSYQIEAYGERALATSDEGSMAIQLYSLPSPLSEISRFAYGAYTPIPPVRNLRLDSLFLMIGHVIWYFIFTYLVIYAYLNYKIIIKSKYVMLMFMFLVILLVGISLTSLDFRHKVTIYPLSFVLYSHSLYKFNINNRFIHTIIFLSLSFIISIYYLIKI